MFSKNKAKPKDHWNIYITPLNIYGKHEVSIVLNYSLCPVDTAFFDSKETAFEWVKSWGERFAECVDLMQETIITEEEVTWDY